MMNGNMIMNKKLYIHCDGGFGNRFNALIVGILISKIGNFEPIVLWPSTNWCRTLFYDIFDYDVKVIEDNLSYFSDNYNEYEFIMHNNFLNLPVQVHNPNIFSGFLSLVDFLKTSKFDKLVYNNDSIPHYAHGSELYEVINQLKFCNQIISSADKFIKVNNLNDNFYGVHLRNTDFYNPHKPNFEKLYIEISNNEDKKYFVCSDDQELENKFNQLENVFIYPKTKYVEKLTEEGDWRSVIVDDTGVEYPFNVERTDESVKQAMIDLYILSKSDIIKTSDSSFLQTASLLKKSRQNG